ncbi:MAG: voltage-gated potassium channel [Chloroflexota bacterium]|nr:voltage-gated potassium channel [Chloroflexota bacterium]
MVLTAPRLSARTVRRRARLAALFLRRERLPRLIALEALILVCGAVAIFFAEHGAEGATIGSIGEAFWFSVVTMTTVGYGDYTPHTALGRVIGVVIMVGGFSLLSIITATIASILVAQRIQEGRGLETIRLRDHVLVCGWNHDAERVLEGLLTGPNKDVAVVLVNELPEETAKETLARHSERELHYVHGDPASELTLERANVAHARAAVVLADTSRGDESAADDRTTLVTLALKSVRADINVTVEVLDLKSEAHLRRAGADHIVISGEFNGFLLSSAAIAPGVAQVVRSLLSFGAAEIHRQSIPPEYVGHSFGELLAALRQRNGFLALAVVTEEKGLSLQDLLTDDLSLVDAFIRQQFSEAGREFLRFEEGGIRVQINPEDSYLIGPTDSVIGVPGRS